MTASVPKRVFSLESPLTARAGPYMYLYPAGNAVASTSGTIPPFHHLCEGALPWYHTCFSTSSYSWGSSGSASCCIMPGQTRVPEGIRSHPTLCRRRASVPATRSRFLASRKPLCAACEQAHEPISQPPGCPPPRIVPTRGRPRQVDTAWQFCPHPHCAYRGWVGLGNISANGHPSGGPWRQLHCTSCDGYFQETHGTPLHGKRVAPDLLVWAVGALAEGLGIRAVARVFEVDPNTMLG